MADEWRGWLYGEWNDCLANHCFGVPEGRQATPLYRIAATPEELVVAVGDSEASPNDVVAAFEHILRNLIPSERQGFCEFCKDPTWGVKSGHLPPFFGALWFTCLIASGYPDEDAGFHDRSKRVFGVSYDYSCLSEVWEQVEAWSRGGKLAKGRPDRHRLVLPEGDGLRTLINYSWYLTFPHDRDRRILVQVLNEAGLVGDEPPLLPTLTVIERNEGTFGQSFRREFRAFRNGFDSGEQDPKDSPFWRAVRGVALSAEGGAIDDGSFSDLGVLASLERDTLSLYLGCTSPESCPAGYKTAELPDPVGPYRYAVRASSNDEQGSATAPLIAALEGRLPITRARVHFARGVLVFQEEIPWEYRLVGGSEAVGADIALVRDDKLEAFIEAFGGTPQPSEYAGWHQVFDCYVRVELDAVPGLEAVAHLQRTTFAPGVRIVGGIRSGGKYLAVPGFLPFVRDRDATHVELQDGTSGQRLAASRVNGRNGDWRLPDNLLDIVPKQWKVIVRKEEALGVARESHGSLEIVGTHVGADYKKLVKGTYDVEAAYGGRLQSNGGEILAGIGAAHSERPPDLIELAPDARYLGSHIGDLGTRRLPGYDWVVVGPQKRPELLMFIGDPDDPAPAASESISSGRRRRLWRRAVLQSRRTAVRLPDGRVMPLAATPKVLQAFESFRTHARRVDVRALGEFETDTEDDARSISPGGSWQGVQPDPHIDLVIDALAAMSTGRGGVKLREFLSLLVGAMSFDEGSVANIAAHILRAWVDAGILDLALPHAFPGRIVMARRPFFLAYRIGDRVRATLSGLVPTDVRTTAKSLYRGRPEALLPQTRWAPSLLRFEFESEEILEALERELGVGRTEWLVWPFPNSDVGGKWSEEALGLRRSSLAESHEISARWNWLSGRFENLGADDPACEQAGVVVLRRKHRGSNPIFEVLAGGQSVGWTFLQNSALLYAYKRSGMSSPFAWDAPSGIARVGEAEVFLPTAAGRLATLVGRSLAGPVIAADGRAVEAYRYPLDRAYCAAFEGLIAANTVFPASAG